MKSFRSMIKDHVKGIKENVEILINSIPRVSLFMLIEGDTRDAIGLIRHYQSEISKYESERVYW